MFLKDFGKVLNSEYTLEENRFVEKALKISLLVTAATSSGPFSAVQ